MKHRLLIALTAVLLSACTTDKPAISNPAKTAPPRIGKSTKPESEKMESAKPAMREVATFGAGCFWCVEAVLERLDGVTSVTSGYMGGKVENPTYEQICTGTTGHAEVVHVEFDPDKISFKKLLIWFFKLHDPTTLNRQGADEGTQYRSVVFYHSEEQRAAAEKAKKTIDDSKVFKDPVVTEITKAEKLYPGEDYHQDFYARNKSHGYCRAVIQPKLDKLGLDK